MDNQDFLKIMQDISVKYITDDETTPTTCGVLATAIGETLVAYDQELAQDFRSVIIPALMEVVTEALLNEDD